jgi:hypothetical protein
MTIEIAWGWLCYQPRSKLGLWFNERFARGGSRMRRICPVGKAPVVLLVVPNTVLLDGAPSKSVRQSATHAHVV